MRRLAAPLLLCLAPLVAQDDPVFTTDVSLVNLLVTVRDESGGPMGDLTREDFQILDRGEPQDIAVFERRTNRPLSVVMLVDASLSTAIELQFERDSAARFAKNLLGEGSQPGDRIAVMKFSEGVELLADFSRSGENVRRAMNRVKPESGTSMYDAVVLGAEELERREGRRVLVIITDGGETTSYSSFLDAVKSAHAADAVIYGLIVTPIKSDAGRNTGGENALKMFAANTGGKSFFGSEEAELDQAFDEIIQNLRMQYMLGYYPPEHDDPRSQFRDVKVNVTAPGAQIYSRNGYYVAPPRKKLPEPTNVVVPERVSIKQRPPGWRKAEPRAKPASHKAPPPKRSERGGP